MSRTAKIVMGVLGFVALGALALEFAPEQLFSPAAPKGALYLAVQKGQDSLRVTNDTDSTWDRCTVELSGGFRKAIPTMKPHESVEIPYREFTNGSTAFLVTGGSSAAQESTQVVCGSTTARIYER